MSLEPLLLPETLLLPINVEQESVFKSSIYSVVILREIKFKYFYLYKYDCLNFLKNRKKNLSAYLHSITVPAHCTCLGLQATLCSCRE